MNRLEYEKFLEKKLFLVEMLSLDKWLETHDETLKEIHEICISSPSSIQKYWRKSESTENK